ncbi:MAG: sel1 repeat family protein [Asticcacaulis sp.]|nr:sel1 repeat family protein [Asticcacaulis sp.]
MAAKKSSNSMLVAAGGTAIVLLAVTFVASQDWSHGRNRILDLAGASMGDAHARYDYAGRLEKDGKKQAALEWYEKSADGGYVPAMMAVADRYEAFDDEDSGDTAVKWYEKAAKAGNAEAMRKLAHAHETGRGSLQPSPILARGYFEQAAKAGDIESKARFGQMLMEEGKLKEAETWLTQAAAAGNGDAAASLGNLYYDFYSPLGRSVEMGADRQ